MATLAGGFRRRRDRRGGNRGGSRTRGLGSLFLPAGQFSYRSQQSEPMTERRNTNLFKVLIRKIGQD